MKHLIHLVLNKCYHYCCSGTFMHIEDLFRLTVTGLTCVATSEPPQSHFCSKGTSLGRMAGLVVAAATLPSLSQLHWSVRNGAWLCHYGASSTLPCLWPRHLDSPFSPCLGTLLTSNLKNIVWHAWTPSLCRFRLLPSEIITEINYVSQTNQIVHSGEGCLGRHEGSQTYSSRVPQIADTRSLLPGQREASVRILVRNVCKQFLSS